MDVPQRIHFNLAFIEQISFFLYSYFIGLHNISLNYSHTMTRESDINRFGANNGG